VRIIGIDYGTERIGVAVSDPLGMMASPRTVLQARPLAKLLAELGKICSETEASAVVVGLPKHMSGAEGKSAEAARALGAEIAKAMPSVKVFYQDERMSTMAAGKMMIEAGGSASKRKASIDAAAAAIILQTFLDQQANNE
jgi:putative Holliday junction resolvase